NPGSARTRPRHRCGTPCCAEARSNRQADRCRSDAARCRHGGRLCGAVRKVPPATCAHRGGVRLLHPSRYRGAPALVRDAGDAYAPRGGACRCASGDVAACRRKGRVARMTPTNAIDRDEILSIDAVTALSREVAAEYDSRLEVIGVASTAGESSRVEVFVT